MTQRSRRDNELPRDLRRNKRRDTRLWFLNLDFEIIQKLLKLESRPPDHPAPGPSNTQLIHPTINQDTSNSIYSSIHRSPSSPTTTTTKSQPLSSFNYYPLSHTHTNTAKMSIIQQVTTASLSDNWRTINIDLLDPESSSNFDTSTLHPQFAPVSDNEIRSTGQQVRQLLRGGDAEGALRGALESAPYGGDAGVKVCDVLFFEETRRRRENGPVRGMLGRCGGCVWQGRVVHQRRDGRRRKYLFKRRTANALGSRLKRILRLGVYRSAR